jgi:glycosyltransferase involved in cell wall biosynthesis
MTVSIALAAHNGSNYLAEQVASILPQLRPDDELVISIDPSTDATHAIAQNLAAFYPQVAVLDGPGRGVQANFEQLIAACSGRHIFLCDHDDIWMPDKIAEVLWAFDSSKAALILHDAEVVDQDLNTLAPSFFAQRGSKPGYLRNVFKNSYIGCCMAFASSLKPVILPFPRAIPMHDQWIGVLAQKYGGVHFLDKPLIKYRRHGQNATSLQHAGLFQMLKWRRDLARALQQRDKELAAATNTWR